MCFEKALHKVFLTLSVCSLLACGSGGDGANSNATVEQSDSALVDLGSALNGTSPDLGVTPIGTPGDPLQRWQPESGATWQYQLKGQVNTGYQVDAYVIDLFDNSSTLIAELQARGVRVVCYFSAGSHEIWRDDLGGIPESAIGMNLDDWPGERWLDIRAVAVRRLMLSRLDLARSKGCDGVEPDNVDAFEQQSGFPLNYDIQLAFNRFLIDSAHIRNLSIGLKNNLQQVNDLVDDYDFAINEECFTYSECDLLTPFVERNKAVFHVEYRPELFDSNSSVTSLCLNLQNQGLSPVLLPLNLDDSFRISCQ